MANEAGSARTSEGLTTGVICARLLHIDFGLVGNKKKKSRASHSAEKVHNVKRHDSGTFRSASLRAACTGLLTSPLFSGLQAPKGDSTLRC